MSKIKKRWSKEETLTFLQYFKARKNEFKLPRKRRLAFARVLQDLHAVGFDPNTSVSHLEIKMQTLLRTYKCAIAMEQEAKHSSSPYLPPFFNELEEIFGERQKKNETFNFNAENFVFTVSEVTASNKPSTPVCSLSLANAFPKVPEGSGGADSIPDDVTIKTEDFTEPSGVAISIQEEVNIKSEDVPESSDAAVFIPEVQISTAGVAEQSTSRASSPSSSSSESTTPIKKPKKKISRSEYYKRRLDQWDREQEAIAERWKQHQQAKEEWRKKKLDMLQKILEKC